MLMLAMAMAALGFSMMALDRLLEGAVVVFLSLPIFALAAVKVALERAEK